MTKPNLANFTEFGRKIVGVGFNFKSLITQMGMAPVKEPRIYLKAPSSYVNQGQKIIIPRRCPESVFYEVELGVVIEKPLYRARPDEVLDAIGGYCTALDMTDMSGLNEARQSGRSWCVAKSFNTACPVGRLIPKDRLPNLNDLSLWLKVNGSLRQHGNTSDMTWPVLDLISIISSYFTLEYGDMILTGTPPGMGAARIDDVIEAGIGDEDSIQFEVGLQDVSDGA